MAVYKVIQDVESEDKILGPLSLKGFVYAGIAAVLIFICVRLGISGAAPLFKIIMLVLLLPPALLFGVLASPLGREQPTEVWLLSRIKFMFKSRERKWDQSGIKQLVKVTVPKRATQQLTKNLSKDEVSSRLQALANTLDSRGWAVRNASLNINPQPPVEDIEETGERLASATVEAVTQPTVDIKESDDILDEQNNQSAQKMQVLLDEADNKRRMAVQEQLDKARQEAQKANASRKSAPSPATQKDPSQMTKEERDLLKKIHEEQSEIILHPPKIIKGAARSEIMTPGAQTVKLELSNAGNDLSVATIARLANNVRAGQ